MAALANLPASAAGAAAVMGIPAAAFAVRVHGKEQHLVASLPTADPHVDKILVELGRYEKASKDQPVLAMSLAVEPMVPAKAKEPQTVTVRIATAGERGAEVSFNPRLLKLQAAADPQPGVTPAGAELALEIGDAGIGEIHAFEIHTVCPRCKTPLRLTAMIETDDTIRKILSLCRARHKDRYVECQIMWSWVGDAAVAPGGGMRDEAA